jgi:sulfoxide reductase heme-binding subunit YedZ
MPAWPLYWIGAVPGVTYFYWAVTNQLGADPLKALEHQLGIWALQLLVAGLAVTPIRNLFNVNLIKFRRAIGLLAFFYAVAHFSIYLWLDQQWNWPEIWRDLTKRPYIIFGMLAVLGMVPLALTSNDWSIRKIGPLRWRQWHKLVYPVSVFAALHYLLLVKAWPLEPFVYLGLVLGMILYRFTKDKRRKVSA